MKKIIFSIAGAALVAATILSGCQSSAEKVENARENLQTANADLVEAKIDLNQALQDSIQDFRTSTEQKMTHYDTRIAELKTKTAIQNKENKVVYEKTLAELELKNKQLKTRLQEYKEDGNDKWTSFKKEFKHDMEELGKSIKDLTVNNLK